MQVEGPAKTQVEAQVATRVREPATMPVSGLVPTQAAARAPMRGWGPFTMPAPGLAPTRDNTAARTPALAQPPGPTRATVRQVAGVQRAADSVPRAALRC
jgi:hypothetical protein